MFDSRSAWEPSLGRFLFRVVSDFLGIPSVTKSAREQPLKGGVESGGCRRTLITSRYVSLVSRPWNKKIHPLYKCMTNGWKLARSLLGRNEETLSRQSFLVISQVSFQSARSIPLFILSYSFPNVGYLSIKFVRIVSRGTIWLLSRKVARNLISAQTFSFVFFFCVGNESRAFSKNREILIIISWGINFIIKERPYYDGLCENLMIMLRCKLEIRFWGFRELNSIKLIFKKVKGYSKF